MVIVVVVVVVVVVVTTFEGTALNLISTNYNASLL